MDAVLRQQRARLGGLSTAARGHVNVEPARQAAEARFARQVAAEAEANGEALTPQELGRRADATRRLFFARLAFTSAKARRGRSRRYRWAVPVSETSGTARETDDDGVDLRPAD